MHTQLRDTPLSLNPHTLLAQKPQPVSLPYDLKELPKSTQIVQNINNRELPILDQIIESTSVKSTESNSDAAVDTYKEWEKELHKLNPGFTAVADVMTPTKRN